MLSTVTETATDPNTKEIGSTKIESVEQLRSAILKYMEWIKLLLGETAAGSHHASNEKDILREIHRFAVEKGLSEQREWLLRVLPKYLSSFASGYEVEPERVDPVLIEVSTEEDRILFRIAKLLWSIPVSKGFGRRMQFLVKDRANGKLIGIFSFQSPPLTFPARDRLFSYPPGRKVELVNQTMDVHILGAVPPYSFLLGGKLVALAAASNEVRMAYERKYTGRLTQMEGKPLPPHLVALTTTSAFGRSSLYNRLRYRSLLIAEPIGYTEGYGTFHLELFYPTLRTILEEQGISTRGGFGTGPRKKWQTIVRALERIGLPKDFLRHGVKREVYLFRLIDNLEAYMKGCDPEPMYRDLPFSELARWWRERWLLPRASRTDYWRKWDSRKIADTLLRTFTTADHRSSVLY